MTVTYQISKEHNIYPNLTVYDWLDNEEITGWRINADEGFVFYDTSRADTELAPQGIKEVPVTYYYTVKYLNRRTDWKNFSLIAVPRDSVDEKYIF